LECPCQTGFARPEAYTGSVKKRLQKRDIPDNRECADAADAEADAFAQAMADVVRVPRDPRGRVRPAPQVTAPAPRTPSLAERDIDDGTEAGFVAPGVDRRELRRLKRGEYEPEIRLDLHGQTARDAVAAVRRFIDNGRHRHRCVCIVHGRGLHSERNIPLLKTRVRACLRQHQAVLAYADAPRTDGGTGAVYVLLRKHRAG
jgi:DNA-nicking Smr family endonuclease